MNAVVHIANGLERAAVAHLATSNSWFVRSHESNVVSRPATLYSIEIVAENAMACVRESHTHTFFSSISINIY